jgi:RNA polymerase primary sigma factor
VKEITTNKNILTENSDVLKDFFKDISKYPIYTGEEQIELARKMKAGDIKAREKLITSNLRFVITCAKQYIGQGVSLLDLIQSGMLGLIQSLDKYDPDKGYKVLSFAVWYIRREILKSIYNSGRTIRYPISYICKISKVKKAYEDFVNKYNRDPTEEEIIKLANITQKQYNSVILNKSYCSSLDTPLSQDEDMVLSDIIPDNSNVEFNDTFFKEAISKSLNCLNPREYKVITEFYGLNGEYERPIKEIAKEMNLGDERIRQIRKGAVKKLEKRCGKTLKTLL